MIKPIRRKWLLLAVWLPALTWVPGYLIVVFNLVYRPGQAFGHGIIGVRPVRILGLYFLASLLALIFNNFQLKELNERQRQRLLLVGGAVACSYVPGKSKIHYLWLVYVFSFVAYVLIPRAMEPAFLNRPWRLIFLCLALVLALAALRLYHKRYFYPNNSIIYEDSPDISPVELFRVS